MRPIRYSDFVLLTLMAASIVLLGLPTMVSAQTIDTGCDQNALDDSKQYFKELRLQYIKDPASVDELEFRLAASEYIGMAEQCYSAEYGEADSGQMIDEGGMLMGAGGAETAFDVSEYFLWGTKWCAGTSFTQGSDLSGPRISGGTVTYSFMANGIVLDGSAPNVAITSLATYSLCFLDEIELALGAWSAVADIQFVPVTDGGEAFNGAPVADIRIGAHVFDGPGSVLAHAFFPPPNGTGAAGDTHFDSGEPWACAPGAGSFGLGIVALHEFGHAIGLGHNDTADIAVMDPFYSAALTFGPLADDFMGVGEIYGTGGAAVTTHFGPVGIGTDTPTEKLHVKDGDFKVEQTTPGTHAILKFATAGSSWEIKQNGTTGRLTFFSPGGGATTASFKFAPAAQENLFRVGVLAGDTVDINGKLVINGTNVTPDYVFDPDYALESIEEHADLMWRNKHLPALPGAAANGEEGVDVVKHQFGVLEELEKAHIYIAQLNETLKELRAEVAELKQE